MPEINWKVRRKREALDNFPLLLYILAAKTILLCLAFAGVKIYQSKKLEATLKLEREARLRRAAEKEEMTEEEEMREEEGMAEKAEMDKKDD
ncbi:small integral membrane protein 11A isoform X1 [Xenopus laevis]|uniref:Small integral membrane protein 11A isoform X1 n=1 Tax=Xenopus laevis TaxID=8355 RepID=A0A8J1M719_XENLA|nr:small integral membrane protein 11A isoform X1 [Xenopus laevis]XP_041437494.1 small integral membrane protein 11A isoform X1 [Xenopus laevis]